MCFPEAVSGESVGLGDTVSMMTRLLTMLLLLLGEVISQTQEAGRDRRPQRRRCFTCRSRGDRGDCRDPFIAPETEENRRQSVDAAVEEVPCSTGWCSKVLEGLDKNFGDNDYGIATERQCMERAPSDNQERCDFVQLGLKKVSITVSIVIIIMILL